MSDSPTPRPDQEPDHLDPGTEPDHPQPDQGPPAAGAAPDGGSGRGEAPPPPQPQAVRAALETLPVPEPGERFWEQLDASLADETPLQIAPRPAIRPITQPPSATGGPPVAEDVFDRGGHRRSFGWAAVKERLRRRPSLPAILVVGAVVVALAVVGGLFDDDRPDDVVTDADREDAEDRVARSDEDGAEEGADGSDGAETDSEAPEETTTTEPQGPVGLSGDDVRLHPRGLGTTLQMGTMTLRDVAASTQVLPNVDELAFDHNSSCYDARLPGVEGLTLWAVGGPEDPYDGALSAVTISVSPRPSPVTDTGLGLGSSEEDVLETYGDSLRRTANPDPAYSRGSIYVAGQEDDDYALAFVTDGSRVLEIRAGHEPLISRPTMCA